MFADRFVLVSPEFTSEKFPADRLKKAVKTWGNVVAFSRKPVKLIDQQTGQILATGNRRTTGISKIKRQILKAA